MKTYANGMKATEFSKKQIGVIYYKAKDGELKVEKWVMSDLYNNAEYYGYDYNGDTARAEQRILHILENVFSGNIEKAQEEIDAYTEIVFSSMTMKYQKNADRNFVA